MAKAQLSAKRLIKEGERQKSNGRLIKDRRLTKRGAYGSVKASFYTGRQPKDFGNHTMNGLDVALFLMSICLTRSY